MRFSPSEIFSGRRSLGLTHT